LTRPPVNCAWLKVMLPLVNRAWLRLTLAAGEHRAGEVAAVEDRAGEVEVVPLPRHRRTLPQVRGDHADDRQPHLPFL